MNKEYLKDRFCGCIAGGAAGDALGYVVEFMSRRQIVERYGSTGIRSYDSGRGGPALFSDDTQMTLFTAEALLHAAETGEDCLECVRSGYVSWYAAQTGACEAAEWSLLAHNPHMKASRAPGVTCLNSLNMWSVGRSPKNDSKGCGGVMRIAPVALYGYASGAFDADGVARFSAEASRLTHLHPLGYIPAASLGWLIYMLLKSNDISGAEMKRLVEESLDVLDRLPEFDCYSREKDYFRTLVQRAVLLAENGDDDVANIGRLGEGWVAEEAVAIAVYCAVKYVDDFSGALAAAVNHDGDSDSTGAICGNISGAARGYSHIPEQFKSGLEELDLLIDMSEMLAKTHEYAD